MGLVIRGRYWSDKGIFMAEIPSIRLQATGKTPDECIQALKLQLEQMVNEEGFECSIHLEAGSVFNVRGQDPAQFEKFLLRTIAERKAYQKPASPDF